MVYESPLDGASSKCIPPYNFGRSCPISWILILHFQLLPRLCAKCFRTSQITSLAPPMFDRDSLWTKITVVDFFGGMFNVAVIRENQAGFSTIFTLQLLPPPKCKKTEEPNLSDTPPGIKPGPSWDNYSHICSLAPQPSAP